VTLRIWREGRAVEICDMGQAFDRLSLAPPDMGGDVADRPVGGLGVFRVRQRADEIHYQRRRDANALAMMIRNRPAEH
jgi:serine/threonine-protein kinase RsbW